MTAKLNTEQQIGWFKAYGIDLLDFAIRRQNGIFIYRNTQAISLTDTDRLDRTLKWLRAENTKHNANIYVRPARGMSWPILFLDDLLDHRTITDKHRAMAIHTSPEGGFQAWISTTAPLSEDQRRAAQETLIAQHGADAGSKSGEHWGRLAGFKNHKRDGCWVNFTTASDQPAIDSRHLIPNGTDAHNGGQVVFHHPRPGRTGGVDKSESAKEFGWVINYLRAGGSRQEAYNRLHARASSRGKTGDIDRYVNLTISNAEQRLSNH
ncbi:MAG: RepB family DNA primase [Candidatus Thiodiazotropha taylori]|nr:RepB family DNA primase [Candidatus Thiodiazotropha taylori]MCW4226984.1 RepB family DNA primase [Candidatus Thiodiazotropha endolucinida]MCG7882923.1 RepB family DNA primase [Candidatus Thiodiazotropha taylori]MCG7888543.1 RepB family DNA primase [Candidatus Thiodiazotropha taylori]MCG7892263.1 RepB family DNA primase [Candidatus Thiodiazotropha taylori]